MRTNSITARIISAAGTAVRTVFRRGTPTPTNQLPMDTVTIAKVEAKLPETPEDLKIFLEGFKRAGGESRFSQRDVENCLYGLDKPWQIKMTGELAQLDKMEGEDIWHIVESAKTPEQMDIKLDLTKTLLKSGICHNDYSDGLRVYDESERIKRFVTGADCPEQVELVLSGLQRRLSDENLIKILYGTKFPEQAGLANRVLKLKNEDGQVLYPNSRAVERDWTIEHIIKNADTPEKVARVLELIPEDNIVKGSETTFLNAAYDAASGTNISR